MPRSLRLAGWLSIGVGVLMLVQWAFFIARGEVPELASEPIRIAFHLAAEAVTAIALTLTGVLVLRGAPRGPVLGLFASGMLAYTAIVSPGYFAQQGEWPLVAMFVVVLAVAAATAVVFAREATRR